MSNIRWIAADWGASNLRVWGIDDKGSIVCDGTSSKGMRQLQPGEFEAALLEIIEDWLPKDSDSIQVLACGMVGAKQGWIEAPYESVPCKPGMTITEAPTSDDRIQVFVLPGVSQSEPADVMRGEETQISGFLSDKPNWSGVVCLPGTHSKWVRVDKGHIVHFNTYMTGELFDILKNHSMLKHSIAENEPFGDIFEKAVSEVLNKSNSLMSHLFGIRAGGLLHGVSDAQSTTRLSGLIIGSEISAARDYWENTNQIQILAPNAIRALYVRAISVASKEVDCSDIEQFTLAGIIAAKTTHFNNKQAKNKYD